LSVKSKHIYKAPHYVASMPEFSASKISIQGLSTSLGRTVTAIQSKYLHTSVACSYIYVVMLLYGLMSLCSGRLAGLSLNWFGLNLWAVIAEFC